MSFVFFRPIPLPSVCIMHTKGLCLLYAWWCMMHDVCTIFVQSMGKHQCFIPSRQVCYQSSESGSMEDWACLYGKWVKNLESCAPPLAAQLLAPSTIEKSNEMVPSFLKFCCFQAHYATVHIVSVRKHFFFQCGTQLFKGKQCTLGAHRFQSFLLQNYVYFISFHPANFVEHLESFRSPTRRLHIFLNYSSCTYVSSLTLA